jgi:adhesin transport system membrane fusion protein
MSKQMTEIFKARMLMYVILMLLVTFFTWAYFAELDEITRGPATVIPSSKTQIVQSQDGGILEQLLVREGDVVVSGQLIAKIDETRARAAYLETRAKVAALAAKVARLEAEVLDLPPNFPNVLNDYSQFKDTQLLLLKKRRDALSDEIKSLEDILQLARDELELNIPLIAAGDVSRTEILKIKREVATLQADITNRRNEYFSDTQSQLAEAEQGLASVEQTLLQKVNLLEQTQLYSPMNGIVKSVLINTVGGVIQSGEDVIEIVPVEDDLIVEAKISPGEIAFLKMGDVASVKIDTYDFTIYGALKGELIFISADTVTDNLKQDEQPYYRVQVRVSAVSVKEKGFQMQPGMTATVEVLSGKRSVLNFLLKPIVKTLSESLGER